MSGPLDPSDPRFAYLVTIMGEQRPRGRGGCGAATLGAIVILLGFCLLIGFFAR